MKYRLVIALLLSLAACGKQESLDLEQDQVFSKQFSSEQLLLANDRGEDITIRPMRVGSESGARGFTSQSYYGNCTSIYGCQSNPYSQWLGYSNLAHAWNPGITRTVNLNFGSRTPVLPNQDTAGFCVDLKISSSRTLRVLRFNPGSAGGFSPSSSQNNVSGSGTNTITVRAQAGYIGQLIFAVQDQQSLQQYCPNQYGQNWNQGNWWDFSYNYPSCSAPLAQATLTVTGTAGPCGGGRAVNIDLSAKINAQSGFDPNNWWSQGQQMPYFSSADGNVWGRVLQYSGEAGINFWGI